jgi:hypothetical protein
MNDTTDAPLLHRLLDEAFAPYPVTPETLDLKQEVRANLAARAAELRASGATASDAARTAIAELGDVALLLDEPATSAPARFSWVAEERRHHVRPRAAYVVRTALAATVLALMLALVIVDAVGVLPLGPARLPILGLAAILIGWLVIDALRQETTVHFPMSTGRAIGFGVAATVLAAGLGAARALLDGLEPGWLLAAIALVVAAIALFTILGVTQTNRAKPWVVQAQSASAVVPNRFDEDPAAAARFGMYTAVLWIVAFVTFLVLSFTVGWAWSWLALLGGFVVMLLLLARMLFGEPKR